MLQLVVRLKYLMRIVNRVTISDAKHFIRSEIFRAWQLRWQQSNSKLSQIKNSVKPWSKLPQLRKEQVLISRLRIGHTNLTHCYFITRENPPRCEQCNVSLSVQHFLIDCPRFNQERQTHGKPSTISQALGEHCTFKNMFVSKIGFLNNL